MRAFISTFAFFNGFLSALGCVHHYQAYNSMTAAFFFVLTVFFFLVSFVTIMQIFDR